MDDTEFRALVRRMRTAQRQYFQSRSPEALAESKALEAQVDKVLSGQLSLFGGGNE